MAVGFPILHASENFRKEEKDKELKAKKKKVEDRKAERKTVYRDSVPEGQEDVSIDSKINRQGDFDGPTLVGYILATLGIHLVEALCCAEFFTQQREFSEAQMRDQAKEAAIANGETTDNGIRLAYEPLRDPNTNFKTPLLDKKGDLVFPEIYPVRNGQVDYNSVPNTDGTAPRYHILMNGFVPKENLKAAYETQMIKLIKDFAGTSSLNNRERAYVKIFAQEQSSKKDKKDLGGAYQQQQQAKQQAPRPSTRPGH